jgi:hypothetical protein
MSTDPAHRPRINQVSHKLKKIMKSVSSKPEIEDLENAHSESLNFSNVLEAAVIAGFERYTKEKFEVLNDQLDIVY